MGKTRDTGFLNNCVFTDSSNNVGIGAASNASFKLQVTGTTNLTGALSGTSATFSSSMAIGTTLSAWDTGTFPDILQVGNASLVTLGNAYSQLGNNSYYDGTNYRYISNGGAQRMVYDDSGNIIWATAASGTAGNTFTYSERMRIYSEGQIGIKGAAATEAAYGLFTNDANTGFFNIFAGGSGTATKGIKLKVTSGSSTIDAMTITSGGNVGIGTSSPGNKLEVVGDIYASGGSVILEGRLTGGGGVASKMDIYSSSNASGTEPIRFFTANAERMRITSGGYVGINTSSPRGYFNVKNGSGELVLSQGNGRDIQAIFNGSQGNMDLSCNNLYISYLGTGTVYSNGGVLTNTNPSDANLKENITDLSFGLNEILQLRPVSYDWKNNAANQSTQYGFIAQEVQKVLPQLVNEFDSYEDEKREIPIKRLGLDKDAIFVSLVKAIQELEARIKQLENK